jgi:hypothetical protein
MLGHSLPASWFDYKIVRQRIDEYDVSGATYAALSFAILAAKLRQETVFVGQAVM